ncbi:MAG TPA: glycosyltransferase, partial [Candidatus Obscuribacterales bacterium]
MTHLTSVRAGCFSMFHSRPLISVCLPVCDGAAFLAETLDSILSQSVQDFEVVVPDDCSTDHSLEIVAKYARLDRRIKCWRNPRRYGLFANYNQCIQECSGLYIKPMAQDDVLLPDMLERCVNVLSSNRNVSLVSTGRTVVDESGLPILSDVTAETPETLFGRGDVYPGEEVLRACLIPLRNIIGEPCTVMFRWEGARLNFNEKLSHLGDLELWLRLLKEGDYSYIPEELVKFRRHQKSATSRNIAQLRIASDIVQLAKLLSPTLADLGC